MTPADSAEALRTAYRDAGRPWAQRVALLGIAGSHAHGTHLPPGDPHSTDDVDVVAVYVHDLDYYLGLSNYNHWRDCFNSNGSAVDITAYDVPKYIALLGKGNPNVHSWLWQPDDLPMLLGPGGRILVAERERLLSRKMFPAIMGYASAQFKKMKQGQSQGYMGAKRKVLLQEYGYDIKDAAHCLRLLHLGRVLASEHRLMVRLDGEPLADVMAVKSGRWPFAKVEREAERLMTEYESSRRMSSLREDITDDELNALSRRVIEAELSDAGRDSSGIGESQT